MSKGFPFGAQTQLGGYPLANAADERLSKGAKLPFGRLRESGNPPSAMIAGVLSKNSQKGFVTASGPQVAHDKPFG